MERPLTGEPMAVDLVNTRWHAADGERDLLATGAGLQQWVSEQDHWISEQDQGISERDQGLSGQGQFARRASEPVRAALIHTRDVLQRAFERQPGAEQDLNAVLARALIVRSLQDGQTRERQLLADDVWQLPWLAADNYLRLRETGPDAIRRCGNPDCVLYFYDPAGRRRWCSMAGCGNRAKARRHYANRHYANRQSANRHSGDGRPDDAR